MVSDVFVIMVFMKILMDLGSINIRKISAGAVFTFCLKIGIIIATVPAERLFKECPANQS
jgi:hypothetical protein